MYARRSFLGYVATAAAAGLVSMAAGRRLAVASESVSVGNGTRRAARRPFPDVILRDDTNRTHRLYDDLYRDRVTVSHVTYAECAGICPLAVQNLKRVHALMGDRVGRDFHIRTLTLNPDRDTPERLRAYRQRENIPEPGWALLTGTARDVELTRRRLGFYDLDPVVDADLRQHTGLLTIGNDRHDWWCMTPSQASPALIVAAIDRMLRYD